MSSSYIIWDVLSSLLLGACGLSPLVVGNEANRYIRRSMDQVKSVVIMAHIPGAVVKYSIYCIALNRIPRSYFRILDPRSNSQLAMLGGIRVPYSPRLLDQGSSFLKYLPQQSRHKNCEHDPQFYRRLCKYQLPKLYHLGNPININTWTKTNMHNQNVIPI